GGGDVAFLGAGGGGAGDLGAGGGGGGLLDEGDDGALAAVAGGDSCENVDPSETVTWRDCKRPSFLELSCEVFRADIKINKVEKIIISKWIIFV
ncbi:hypothetical protein RhiirA5_362620, partial [Rhizophagus irregularis]